MCFSQATNPTKFSKLIAHAEFHDQTAAIPQATLFTPQRDGLFRLSVYGVTTVPEQGPCESQGDIDVSASLLLTFADDSGPNFVALIPTGNLASQGVLFGVSTSSEIVIQAKAGTPITFAVPFVVNPPCSLTAPAHYSFFIALERLF